jgi:hypothetical protein
MNPYVDGGDCPPRKIYYHSGNDIGGCEGLMMWFAATAPAFRRGQRMEGYTMRHSTCRTETTIKVTCWMNGWFYRYASPPSTIPFSWEKSQSWRDDRRPGKEGSSGGWANLHFDIKALNLPAKASRMPTLFFVSICSRT